LPFFGLVIYKQAPKAKLIEKKQTIWQNRYAYFAYLLFSTNNNHTFAVFKFYLLFRVNSLDVM